MTATLTQHAATRHGASAQQESLRADIATAARLIPPAWPLTSFVAVNPLRGLEHLPFDDACSEAARWFGARTHLSLAAYREAYRHGAVTAADLHAAIIDADPSVAASTVQVAGHAVAVVDLFAHDLVHGPDDVAYPAENRENSGDSAWRRDVATYVGTWCAAFVDEAGTSAAMPHRELGFFAAWSRVAAADPRLRQLVGRAGRRWIGTLPTDPVAALDRAFETSHVPAHERTDAIRALLTCLPGWAGYARWADEWAPPDSAAPRLRVVDLVAVLATIDAASGGRELTVIHAHDTDTDTASAAAAQHFAARVEALARWVAGDAPVGDGDRRAVAQALAGLPEPARQAIWLAAHERRYRDELVGMLDTHPPTPPLSRPAAQLVACIDVRSELLRRHLEAVGDYETFGFAGFFGVPVRWRPAGSSLSEARCPVLVTPGHEVVEQYEAEPHAMVGGGAELGAQHAFHAAKANLASPFALAESAGWLAGPAAALRTLVRPRGAGDRRARTTRVRVATEHDAPFGLTLDQRTLFAEAMVRTIGMHSFAPIVVLCGHGSRTENNPHASSLDCGACGGAPGGASARIAVAIMNDDGVRDALRERGIEVPETTWFVAAEHDTASDRVDLLDLHLSPAGHRDAIGQLDHDLRIASERVAAERAERLPGDRRAVRSRGRDWAQVRPEWGLAGNAAFVAAPRRITSGLDLEGRTFLHSYDATSDPSGVALETILTAPLVVAQWINAQYYFSSVDPDVFGAGDKLLHNPVGGVGVVRGLAGDLAIGLPEQSVAVGERLVHQPLRLLAVVQAPLELIETILARNPSVRSLLEHRWISMVARAADDDTWSVRSRAGTWTTWHPAEALCDTAAVARAAGVAA